jgi:hypothetical protein
MKIKFLLCFMMNKEMIKNNFVTLLKKEKTFQQDLPDN